MPIYYVVCEDVGGPRTNFIQMWQILHVYETTIEESGDIWRIAVQPLFNIGQARRIAAYAFVREPENPFKDQVFQGSIVP